MQNEKMVVALNSQINAELYSAYLYLSMAAYFESVNLPGFANWMEIQGQEETGHAMKIYQFMNSRSWRVKLLEIAKPQAEWQSPVAVIREVLAHEQKVTALINNLVDIAIETKDHAVHSFLNWFVNEQVEEEANANDILHKLTLVGDNSGLLLMLDKELGSRTLQSN